MNQTVTKLEMRDSVRKNMFLAAVLAAPSGAFPAKVRNMSSSGALIEASLLPEQGTPVRLFRGSLQVSGRIAWRSESRCGIAFSSLVNVDNWLAPDRNCRQDNVDLLADRLRGGSFQESPGNRAEGAVQPPSIIETANLIADLLRAVEHRLADDAAIVASHALELQAFDLAVQSLQAMSSEPIVGSSTRLADTAAACTELLKIIQIKSSRTNQQKTESEMSAAKS